jgi:hypothetical protein
LKYFLSSEGSRRSLAYTESDLDASENWDDDDNASNDSMLADDEYDDYEIGEIIFSKPYIEHDEKADAMFSYNMVKTLPESPVVWEPEADDDDVFQDTPIVTQLYFIQISINLMKLSEYLIFCRLTEREVHSSPPLRFRKSPFVHAMFVIVHGSLASVYAHHQMLPQKNQSNLLHVHDTHYLL